MIRVSSQWKQQNLLTSSLWFLIGRQRMLWVLYPVIRSTSALNLESWRVRIHQICQIRACKPHLSSHGSSNMKPGVKINTPITVKHHLITRITSIFLDSQGHKRGESEGRERRLVDLREWADVRKIRQVWRSKAVDA